MPHSHDHPTHAHAHDGLDNERRVFWAMLLIGSFMFVELIGGLLSGSLALLADAGHMLTDFLSLALAWIGFRISRRPADLNRTYGYYRFEVLAAFINGMALFAIVAWIFYEAAIRFFKPIQILGGAMLIVAALGLLVNILAFLLLHGGDRANLNIRGAAAHVLGDLLGSVGAVAAAVIILRTGWNPIDPLVSLLVGLLILKSAWAIVSDSAHILLEGKPQHIDIDRLSTDLKDNVREVQSVHHVHIWSLTPQRLLMTLHVTVDCDSDQDSVLEKVKVFLDRQWHVTHSTVQIERTGCPDGHSTQNRSCR